MSLLLLSSLLACSGSATDSGTVSTWTRDDYLGLWDLQEQVILDMQCPYFDDDYLRDDLLDEDGTVVRVTERPGRETLSGVECEPIENGFLCYPEYATLFYFRDPGEMFWGRVRVFDTNLRVDASCSRIQTDEHILVRDGDAIIETVYTDMQAIGDDCDTATQQLKDRSGLDYELDGCHMIWQMTYQPHVGSN